MDDVVKAASRHRWHLAQGQKKATTQLARSYAEVWTSVRRDWVNLSRKIAEAQALGQDVSPAWLDRQQAYRTLLLNLERELVALAPIVADAAAPLIDQALAAAAVDAAELATLAQGQPFGGVLNARAATTISGATSRGPVAQLIANRAGEHAEAAARIIREGVIRGLNPGVTTRRLRAVTGNAFTNAATVVRTETYRAYREGVRQSFADNPAVSRWRWFARRTPRTCAFCWAQDGTEWASNRVMPTHPNCQCVMLPVVEGVDYGPTGPELFAAQPDEVKRAVLGPCGHAAHAAGEFELADLVRTGRHPVWGPTGGTKSLSDVLGAPRVAELRREVAAARAAG